MVMIEPDDDDQADEGKPMRPARHLGFLRPGVCRIAGLSALLKSGALHALHALQHESRTVAAAEGQGS